VVSHKHPLTKNKRTSEQANKRTSEQANKRQEQANKRTSAKNKRTSEQANKVEAPRWGVYAETTKIID
jgi:hypothetical protein